MEEEALFNHCTHDLTELLRALKGQACPLCSVLSARMHELVRSAAENPRSETQLLCAQHLAFVLEHIKDSGTKANLLRSNIILASTAGTAARPACPICASLEHTAATLRRAIQRLDVKARFQKVIAAGPLFCLSHRDQICTRNVAPYFAQVQRAKLKRLTHELLQAEPHGEVATHRVIAQTLSYLLQSEAPFVIDSKSPRLGEESSAALQRKVS
jgi:hypothetical protein